MSLPDLSQTGSAYVFLDVTLDVSAERLTRGATEIKLRPKSFQVLRYLVERAGRLVTRDELLEAIWPDVVVTDESITKCVADIRNALHDHSQQVIRTVARRGYVFTASVTKTVEFPRRADHQAEHGRAAVPHDGGPQRPLIEGVPSMSRNAVGLRRWAAIVVVLVVVVGVTIALFVAVRADRGNAAAAVDYTQITNFTDSAFAPALSPDGRMLTFIRGENGETLGGKGEVFIKFLPDGEPIQLTHDGTSKMSPTFTPGSDRIAYGVPALMTNPRGWATWTVSVFGGEPKLLLSNASALRWIPGTSPPQVLFSRVDTGIHMSIVTTTESGTNGRTMYVPPGDAMAHRSFLSPDRRWALVVEMRSGWGPCQLVPVEPDGQIQTSPEVGRPVGPSPGQCSSAAWSPDGKWMYFSVNTGSGYHIWRQRSPDDAPEQVTFGATEEQEIAFAPDGRSIFTSVGTRQSTLWIHDRRGERQITSEGYASLPRFSPDGKKLYYLLRLQANRRYVSGELWFANLETGKRERLFGEFLVTDYSVSPDGTRMLFVAIGDDGDTSIWLVPLDGHTAPRRLSNVHADRAFFGPADEVIFFASEPGAGRFLYRIKEDGTGLQKALREPVDYVYDVSPDGETVAAWLGSAVQVLPLHGGPSVNASMVCAAAGGENRGTTPPCVSWSQNGKFLYLNDRNAEQIYALPIPGGRTVPPLPDGGIASAEQASAWPGARIVREGAAFVGADPSVYAFFRVTTQRNIYRIRLP